VRTYVGIDKSSEIRAIGGGKWAWNFTDPHFGDTFNAFTGTLAECEQLQREYEAPATDIPF